MKKANEYSTYKNSKYVLNCICSWQKVFLAIVLLAIVASAVSSFILPMFVKIIIASIENNDSLKNFLILVIVYSLITLAIYLCNNFCECQRGWRFPSLLNMFRQQLLETMLTMDYCKIERPEVLNEFEKNKNNLNDATKSVQGMLVSLQKLGIYLLQAVIAGLIIGKLQPLLIVFVLLISVMQFFPNNSTKKKDKETVWDTLPPLWRKIFNYNYWSNNFQYAKDIRLFNMSKWLNDKQMAAAEEEHTIVKRSARLWIRCHFVMKILALLQEVLLYVWLIWCTTKGTISISDFTLYVSSVALFSNAVGQSFWEFTNLLNNSKEVTDYRMFLTHSESADSEDEGNLEVSSVIANNEFEIRFENVSYKYEGKDNYALKDINLIISSKEKLAIVGVNGAGKTTLVKLLCRLYEPTEGTIYLNNVDIKRFDKNSYMNYFAPVFQNVEVYAFSVAENISMSREIHEEKIYSVMKKVGIDEKINGLKKGINTSLLQVLDEEGVDLSGGEKQKLALARALYKDSFFVILDEPTAALDAIAENKLYQSFNDLLQDKSAIFISHRLSSTRFCDHIALLADGKLVEYGTHEELVSGGGQYYELYNVQAQYYSEENEVKEDD